MSRCRACDDEVDFGEEFCEPCSTAIYEYNLDLILEEEEEDDGKLPALGEDREGS